MDGLWNGVEHWVTYPWLGKCPIATQEQILKTHFFCISRRNTRQKDPIQTHASRTCCYWISPLYSSSVNIKKRRLSEICSSVAIGHLPYCFLCSIGSFSNKKYFNKLIVNNCKAFFFPCHSTSCYCNKCSTLPVSSSHGSLLEFFSRNIVTGQSS